jgi:hypothetical protein
VVETLATLRELGRRGEAGEGAEVADEMRLVEIAHAYGDLRPIDPFTALDRGHDFLEAPDAADSLGVSRFKFLPEDPYEPPMAEPDPLCHLRDRLRVRRTVKPS